MIQGNSMAISSSRWLLIGKKEYIQGIKKSHINLVNISGNHMGDAGINGLKETIDHFHENNILTIGAGI